MRPLLIAAVGIFALGCNHDTFEADSTEWTDGTVDSTWTCAADPRCTPNLPPLPDSMEDE